LPIAPDIGLKRGQQAFHPGFPRSRPGEAASVLLRRATLLVGWRGLRAEPVLTFAETGRWPAIRGSLAGLSGAPALDADGRVLGVTVAENPRRRRLYTTTPASLRAALAEAGVTPSNGAGEALTEASWRGASDDLRGALSIGVFIMFWLWQRGDYKGVLNQNHWYSIGMLMLAFTVFWGYIAFSQYFLIWNANVPEETFWFNEREFGAWFWVGMLLVFGHFLTPFLLLLSYRFKVTKVILRRIAAWILFTLFIDLCWNILPALKDSAGHALPFFSWPVLWSLTSTIGIGGICAWSYLREVSSTKLIPIHDPRIGESLTHHDDE